MNRYRALLASSLALFFGLAIGGGGCANGGGDSSSGDDGDDGSAVADVTTHEGRDADATGTCPTGKAMCAGVCTDTGTDGKNCGQCGHACGMSQVCNDGTCGYSCTAPETLCNAPPEAGPVPEGGGGPAEGGGGSGDGGGGGGNDAAPAQDAGGAGGDAGAPYCANLTNDNNNCGACGNACGANHTCNTVGGSTACGLSCSAGQVACIAGDVCIPTNTCCATCPIPGEICPMPGGTCQCPGGESYCSASNSCISSNDCCTAADCASVAGSTCPTPGEACQCANGDKVCLSTKSCVAQSACCTAAGACCDDPLGKSCGAATVQAALTVGGAAVSVSGLSTAPGEEDWIQVTFNGETNLAFHGHILFATNPNNEFVFDIASDCKGTLRTCGTEGGSCQAKTEWEEQYAAATPAPDPTGTTWAPIPTVGVTYIRVYRPSPTATSTCDQWTLTISE
jgi:hypothetical protein